ncbi:2-hydroxyacid dehydrogenase [Methylonatrum kenyense]|uniref:2-hydroxyacid dehydrogenase n=1 Tax=Methylonatrum kenyense TaxID=455253 RepID=UPI003D13DF4F
MKAVFLDSETVGEDVSLDAVRDAVDTLHCHRRTGAAQTLAHMRGHEVVISNKVVIQRQHLQALEQPPGLICVAATGTNNVELEACAEAGVKVCNARAYGTDAVAQHALGLMLALSIGLLDYSAAVARGDWQRATQFCLLDYPVRELSGLTLGIVGYGTLGKRVAQLAEAFGMRVLVAQRPGTSSPVPGRVPLAELLPRVDVLSLHCPLTEATRGLIGADELAVMKPDAILINTARGGLVDEQALADVLRAGRLGGAGFDVLTEEPPRNGNVLLEAGIPNLIVTPHTAWASREARQRICDQVAENIRAWRGGQPIRTLI